MSFYTNCTVNNAGPVTNSNETPPPVVYVNLTDGGANPAFRGFWFYAANGSQNQMLAVALAAMNGQKTVNIETDLNTDGSNSPFTAITRMYLNKA